jgi:hypothetical protein
MQNAMALGPVKFVAGKKSSAMLTASKKYGYSRYVVCNKLLLTAAMRAKQPKWAQEMIQFKDRDLNYLTLLYSNTSGRTKPTLFALFTLGSLFVLGIAIGLRVHT